MPQPLSSRPSPFMQTISTIQDQLKDAFYALTSCLGSGQAKVKINGRTFNILKVLGEGGFSLVYLVQDEDSGREFALKKIGCPLGTESVNEAMREVEAYRRFRHKNIIRIMDSAVVQSTDADGDEGGKVVYLFLPVYKRGNIQDAINAHVVNGTHYAETEMLRLFKGTCEGVRAMHEYHLPSSSSGSSSRQQQSSSGHNRLSGEGSRPQDDDDDEHEGDSVPLMGMDSRPKGDGDDGPLRKGDLERPPQGKAGDLCAYAHRDIKPGNVMIADDGTPILMDFGSTMKARVHIINRSEALLQQDIAAQQSTMAYRAPELFDVKTGVDLDESVDIWSLGCTLFAMAYSHSPFETPATIAQGGSIAMAVQSGSYKHPRDASNLYSQGLRDLIDSMLKLKPEERPTIAEVIGKCDEILGRLR
ncbi:Pkinase-domain-containing protein [Flagelloscypha sp. PMI_526]|nr:Pkinase-domain-containing protein [Flagelloscypha sp. PMI_526]